MITPFHDEQGNINFHWNPTADRVFIYPSSPPEKFQEKGLIEIPKLFQDFYQEGIGILLAAGPGFYDERGKWKAVSSLLKPGVKVYYDITVPWKQVVQGLDGKQYVVVLCGESDVLCVLEN